MPGIDIGNNKTLQDEMRKRLREICDEGKDKKITDETVRRLVKV